MFENDVGFEPGMPSRQLYCADIRELVQMVDAFNDPEHLAVCYDFGHANLISGCNHRKNLKMIGSRLRALHIQDNHGNVDEHLLPFHGNIDWKEAMAGLSDIGYQGDLTFEVQEFGRFFPNDRKYLVVEYSRKIGSVLLDLYSAAK